MASDPLADRRFQVMTEEHLWLQSDSKLPIASAKAQNSSSTFCKILIMVYDGNVLHYSAVNQCAIQLGGSQFKFCLIQKVEGAQVTIF